MRPTSFAAGVTAVLLAAITLSTPTLAKPLKDADTDRPAENRRPTRTASDNPLGWVAREASWVVHVDVRALAASKLGDFLREQDELDIDSELEDIEDELGFDPLDEIDHITAYGTDLEEGPEAIVAATSTVVDDLLARAKEEDPDYRAITVNGHPAHSFDDGGAYAHIRPHGDGRLVVVAQSSEHLGRAIDILDGRAPGMSREDAPALAKAPRGTFFAAMIRDFSFIEDEDDEVARVMQHADVAYAWAGESDGETFGRLVVATEEASMARDIADVAQGLVALGRLITSEEPELEPIEGLLRAINVSSDGNEITLDIRVRMDQLHRW